MKKRFFANKRSVLTLFSVIFVLCVAVGSTFAWLGGVKGEQNNVFTGAKNIRARLTEPNWSAAKGLKLVPGKIVKKDPMITNTGETDEYVAIRLTFQYEDEIIMSEADLLRLLNLLKIDWNSKWKLYGGSMTITSGEITAINQPLIFYYDDDLSPGEVSDPIFSSIRVKDEGDGLKEADLRWLQGIKIENGEIITDPDGIGNYLIKVEGAAVQALGFENGLAAANNLKALFP